MTFTHHVTPACLLGNLYIFTVYSSCSVATICFVTLVCSVSFIRSVTESDCIPRCDSYLICDSHLLCNSHLLFNSYLLSSSCLLSNSYRHFSTRLLLIPTTPIPPHTSQSAHLHGLLLCAVFTDNLFCPSILLLLLVDDNNASILL